MAWVRRLEPWSVLLFCALMPPIGVILVPFCRQLSAWTRVMIVGLFLLALVFFLRPNPILDWLQKRRLQHAAEQFDWQKQLDIHRFLMRQEGLAGLSHWLETFRLRRILGSPVPLSEVLELKEALEAELKVAKEWQKLHWRNLLSNAMQTFSLFYPQQALDFLEAGKERILQHEMLHKDRLRFYTLAANLMRGSAPEPTAIAFLRRLADGHGYRLYENYVLALVVQESQPLQHAFAVRPLYFPLKPFESMLQSLEQKSMFEAFRECERLRFVQQNPKKAVECSKELAQEPSNASGGQLLEETHFNLAVLNRVQLKQPKRALPWLDKIVQKSDPFRLEEALYHRMRIYQTLDQPEKAREDRIHLLRRFPASRYRQQIETLKFFDKLKQKLMRWLHSMGLEEAQNE